MGLTHPYRRWRVSSFAFVICWYCHSQYIRPVNRDTDKWGPVSQAGEISYVKSLAREVASKGVTVNGVAPGGIMFEGGGWHRREQADPQGIADFVKHEMPMGRFGTVEEVASVVAFVCSRQASLLNGASIPVAITTNGLRLVATGVLSYLFGPSVDSGVIHVVLGLGFFALAFLSILLIHKILSRHLGHQNPGRVYP